MVGQLAHYGHALEVKHVPIPAQVREAIIELLHEQHRIDDVPGIIRQCESSFSLFILKEVAATNSTMRGYYVEARDVRQIAASNGMSRFDRKVADHASVDALMQEMGKLGEKSPILYYRPATADQKLIVVMQTASMQKVMTDHGRHLLACDTTHDTSRYPGISSYMANPPSNCYPPLLDPKKFATPSFPKTRIFFFWGGGLAMYVYHSIYLITCTFQASCSAH
jgi:hypothetical protein